MENKEAIERLERLRDFGRPKTEEAKQALSAGIAALRREIKRNNAKAALH